MATFGVQLKYLLYRNFKLKIKDKKTLFQEFFVPCIFVLSLLSFTFTLKPKVYQAWPYSAFQNHELISTNGSSGFLPPVEANKSWAYTPDSADARAVLTALRQSLGSDNVPDSFQAFTSEAEMVEAYRSADEPAFSLGLVFGPDFPSVPELAIRMPYENVPSTESDGLFASPVACREWGAPGLWSVNCPANQYLFSGFAVLQTVLQNSVASMLSNESLAMPDFAVRMFPKAAYTQPASTTRVIASIYYVIMFSVYITVLLSYMVYEKEKKIKETMLMMGMSSGAFWLAWFITYMIIILIVSFVIALLSKYAVQTVPNGNLLIIFLIMFFYGVSIIGLAFMLTPFFNKAMVAGVMGAILTLLLSLIYIPLGLIADVPIVYKWLLSFFSPIAFTLAMDQAISLDGDTGGIQFDNLGLDGFPPYLAMLAIDSLLYFLLAIYFDNVVPGNYGQSKPLFFFLMPSFWCPGSRQTNQPSQPEDYQTVNLDMEDVEPVPPVLKERAAIRIRNLAKTFKGGRRKPDVHAVKGMTLDIYEGQITCLLGHNGAGKTTLVNMLTGLVPATAGQATVYGRSVRDPLQMVEIRNSLGICSQDNTLIEVLSAREHLTFYAGLKGIPSSQIDAQVEKSLRQCLLHEVADTASKDLSGGQKRKLCVGIALIGDPKVIFLDEPSSGMDPYSRRQLWNLLKSQRQGRVTVLTTHFMDEADILADRKAMMSKGTLRCCGSSLFLKTRFGIGYHLGMVVDQEADIEPITDLVKQQVPQAKMSRHYAMELTYTLPLQDADKFPDLFRALEATGDGGDTVARQLGIQMYGVHMTTLEEVFLKLLDMENDDSEEDPGVASDTTPINIASGRDYEATEASTEAVSLDVQHLISKPLDPNKYQLKALCTVLLRQMIRNPETYVSRIMFPILYMVIAVVLSATINFGGNRVSEPTSLALVPQLYLATSPSSVSSSLTPLLYQDNLTSGQDISTLVGQFDRLELTSESIADMSDLMSLAPHSLATVAQDLGTNTSQNAVPSFVALYNDTAIHSLPALLGLLGNALVPLQTAAQTVVNVTVASHPLPPRSTDYTFNSGFFLSFFLAMAFTFMPLGFATSNVKERQEKIRTQLRVSGVTTSNYWLSHFLIDCFQMYFLTVLGVVVLAIMGAALDNVSFSQGGAMVMFVLFMLLFSPMMVMFSYCVGYLFDDYKTCQSFAPFIFYYLPYIFLAPLLALDYTGNSTAASAIHLVSSVICPHYSIYGMFYYIDKVYQVAVVMQRLDQLTFGDYFHFDTMLVPTLLCVLFSNVTMFFLLRLCEIASTGGRWSDVCMWSQGKFGTIRPNPDQILDEDSDVLAERDKVQDIFKRGVPQEGCVMAASGIRKEFPRKSSSSGWDCCGGGKGKGKDTQASTNVAVRNLSLCVAEGEILGLLGPNGAGKTTSMNVITADTKATNGQIQIGGHNITSSLSAAFHSMGFCPQHDPLYETITMREHIETYALLKGIHPDDVSKVATHYMEALKVMEHADKRSEKLSGGTKRKLCFAMSMLGKPKIVFMDEPSTGMDPTSKRFVWNTIIASFRENRGCVLTTHSMEEADAVCSRVAIMISGKLVCLGTTQHLKSKYGEGYVLEVKLNPGQAYYTLDHNSAEARQLLDDLLARLRAKVLQIFPSAEVSETFGERVIYRIPREGALQLSAVFAELEQGKETLNIEEYSFSQATLEQVFIEFAKAQRDDDGSEDRSASPKHASTDMV